MTADRRLFAAALLIAAAVIFVGLPQDRAVFRVLEDSGHAPAFAVLTLALAHVLRSRPHAPADTRLRLMIVAAIAVCLALATEAAQLFVPYKDPSLHDLVFDGVGILIGLALSSEAREYATTWRRFCLGLLIAVALIPLAWCLAAYADRFRQFPTVFRLESLLDLYFAQRTPAMDLTELLHIYRGTRALPLPLAHDAGIALDEPLANWNGQRTLSVDIENADDRPVRVRLRVHDRSHDQSYDDRYNGTIELQGKQRRIFRVPLSEIAAAPARRPLDLSDVAGIGLFALGPFSTRAQPALLHGVWLE